MTEITIGDFVQVPTHQGVCVVTHCFSNLVNLASTDTSIQQKLGLHKITELTLIKKGTGFHSWKNGRFCY